MDSQVPGYWTEEKHVDYLNMIEASFVRGMLGKINVSRGPVLRLDRQLPDGYDSTGDRRSNKLAASAAPGGAVGPTRNGSSNRRAERRRRRRLSSRPYDSSSAVDQVVPEM